MLKTARILAILCCLVAVAHGRTLSNATDDVVFCGMKEETGKCKALMPRIHYDPETDSCQWFVYGGCGGNANNFLTVEDCCQQCGVEVLSSCKANSTQLSAEDYSSSLMGEAIRPGAGLG